jgi:hypothetical protein
MKRLRNLICGMAASVLVAGAAQAQVVGTVVSTDPTTSTIVVKTPDGRQTVYRTTETTTIRQGETTVQLGNVQTGTKVQILSEPAAAPSASAGQTTVHPVASGIIITPGTETTVVPVPSAQQPDVAAPPKDTDVDVNVKTESEED